ncbi:hypothetical protein DPMN_098259 [Dreissena polymorpha]|uniref:Uncharacterized protein n=1 Tax=Dreissena polymorpha TaxID=45954 RepID=A0A9D4R5H1_DREPO|nr:hypothetical protein DPMN_098259 [Dreissena polymorpha]
MLLLKLANLSSVIPARESLAMKSAILNPLMTALFLVNRCATASLQLTATQRDVVTPPSAQRARALTTATVVMDTSVTKETMPLSVRWRRPLPALWT